METGTKVGIGLGVAVLVGAGIYLGFIKKTDAVVFLDEKYQKDHGLDKKQMEQLVAKYGKQTTLKNLSAGLPANADHKLGGLPPRKGGGLPTDKTINADGNDSWKS